MIESLPDRPLTYAEVDALRQSDAIAAVTPVRGFGHPDVGHATVAIALSTAAGGHHALLFVPEEYEHWESGWDDITAVAESHAAAVNALDEIEIPDEDLESAVKDTLGADEGGESR